jgi:hypothetical protein
MFVVNITFEYQSNIKGKNILQKHGILSTKVISSFQLYNIFYSKR